MHPLRPHTVLLYVLFLFSGAAALIYQVLWVRQLGLLVGSTAQAAALAVAIFFAGIAAGGWFWGERVARTRSAIRLFGGLELAVAATALLFFFLVDFYHTLYPLLYARWGVSPLADLFLKSVIATSVLFPSAFFMGGTLPALGHHLIRQHRHLGRTGSWLYAINTFGGALGALAAGFVLPLWLGFQGTYLLAIGLDLSIGLIALLLARSRIPLENETTHPAPSPIPAPSDSTDDSRWPVSLVQLIAFMTGFCALGVEILWTRLFAQVLQNSVYTYALVLTVFLLALALGALLAHGLSRLRRLPTIHVLTGLLLIAAGLVAFSNWIFYGITGGLAYLGVDQDWIAYVRQVSLSTVVVMLIPGIFMGAVLPYLLRMLQSAQRPIGELIGQLIAVNTVGAIAGAWLTGFLLLPLLGVSRSLLLLATLYVWIIGLAWLAQSGANRRIAGFACLLGGLVLQWMPVDRMQVIHVRTAGDEVLVELIEGSHAHAAVIDTEGHRLLRVNNYYTLGSTGALEKERNQTLIPLMLHPQPRRIFYLGMGTGITAGAALAFPVERVVVTEILPEVVRLARRHFGPWTEGLFDDERVVIHAHDGRNQLRRSPEQYDVIISDLFTPWKAGTGNLYTREHYQVARDRLKPGGFLVQWLPAYMISIEEFSIIARTMMEVFPQVVLWRGDLFPSESIIGLVGYPTPTPYDPQVPIAQGRLLAGDEPVADEVFSALSLIFYGGNITASGRFDHAPINTDNRPLIEYLAPRTQRAVQAGRAHWLTDEALATLYEQLMEAVPPTEDPYLINLAPAQRDYIHAGLHYIQAITHLNRGDTETAGILFEKFYRTVPFLSDGNY